MPQDLPGRPTNGPRKPNGASEPLAPFWVWLAMVACFAIIFWNWAPSGEKPVLYEPWFVAQVDGDNIKSLVIHKHDVHGELRQETPYVAAGKRKSTQITKFSTKFPSDADAHAIISKLSNGKRPLATPEPTIHHRPPNATIALVWSTLVIPTIAIVGLICVLLRLAGSRLGSKQPVTFADLPGLEEAKSELNEIIDFLNSPEKYQRLGGRITKNVLLIGPPGAAVPALARAVAGEAGVPFFSISGADLRPMIGGAGASRVCDLFKSAKENSPCVVFIHDIDTVGRVRGVNFEGGADERERTLQQILMEIDGSQTYETVCVLASTGRIDILDPALLGANRFSRHIVC